MQLRYLLYSATVFVGGCAHNKSPAVALAQTPAAAAPTEEEKAQALRQELASAFDARFGQGPKAVQERAQGLRIEDYEVGQGVPARVGSELTLRFVGHLDDGTVFDQSVDGSGPAFRFALPQKPRVEGWGLGLRGMRAGGVRKIIVPSALAYGEQGDPADEDVPPIPPNSTLTYLVKMVSVKPPLAGPEPVTSFEGTVVGQAELSGGLRFEDYKIGSGEAAQSGDKARLYFRGFLKDGAMFSSKDGSAKPIEIVIGHEAVLEGWNKGIVGMKTGGLRKLVVPASMAFGDKGRGPVPPDAELTFMIQLVELIRLPKD